MATVATLPNNLKLEYVERGRRGSVPIVFLHGVTDSWRSFEPTLDHLPSSIHAFALTLRGHGESDKPEDGYQLTTWAADVVAFLDYCELQSAVIVGHSLGSMVAQRFAIDFPQRTAGLVLAGAFASMYRHEGLTEFYRSSIAPLTDPIDLGFVREWQLSTLARPIDEAFLDVVVTETAKVPARVWKAAFTGFVETPDCFQDLGRIRVPTVLTWGENDSYATRDDQDRLLSAIEHAELRVYEGAGHAFHWEDPTRFAEDVARWHREMVAKAA